MDKLTVNKAFVITALQDYLNDKYLRKSVTINNIELVDNIDTINGIPSFVISYELNIEI